MVLDKLYQRGQKGFTLIELSIVLVIIGLIIGGILKGQEIVANARTKSTWNFVNAARAASNTYFDRYRALPGDDPNATTRLDGRITAGDGSGIVGATHAATAALVAANGGTGEMLQYFNALMAANLINGGSVTNSTTATSFGPGSPLPPSPITGAGVVVGYATHAGDGTNAGTARSAHWYILSKATTPAVTMSPRELSTLDTQFDDGNGSFGAVRAPAAETGCYTASTGIYVISDQVLCRPLLEAHP
jgi:prepilin-type N-terminal cleavage/methylation domain-containing protein